ncbi:MAG: GAF domain-containing protein, partial [Aggregatilineales bacterium]
MGSFAFIAIFVGLLTFAGLLIWVRQREQSVQIAEMNAIPGAAIEQNENMLQNDEAVIVTTAHGQVVHVNALLRQWLNLDGAFLPGLEDVAQGVQPVDNFFHLISSETQTAFRLGARWVDASSHFVPSPDGARMVLTLKEAQQGQASDMHHNGHHLDVSQVFQVMGEIGETVDASMGMELCLQLLLEIISRAVPSNAGEITLYDEETDFLQQRGWVGDTRYLLAVAEAGGGYGSGEGLAGLVAQQRRAALIGAEHDDIDIDLILRSDLYCSAVAIPLESSGVLIGTLSLFSAQPANYHDGDVAFLQALSQSITTAIYNASLYARQETRIKDIASIQEIIEHNPSDEDSSGLYAALNERMARLMDAEMSGIFLYDEDREALIPQLPFYGMQDNIASLLTIPLNQNSPQRDVWLHQKYWVSSDLADEPLVETVNLQPIVALAGVHNTAIYPLQIGEKRIGAVAISNKRGGMFSPVDLQNMQVLVHQAAIVVEHMRLSGRERLIDTELMGLQEMTHAIGALSHEGEFYSEITERIARLTGSA